MLGFLVVGLAVAAPGRASAQFGLNVTGLMGGGRRFVQPPAPIADPSGRLAVKPFSPSRQDPFRFALREAEAVLLAGKGPERRPSLGARFRAGQLSEEEVLTLAVLTQDADERRRILEEHASQPAASDTARGMLARTLLELGRAKEAGESLASVDPACRQPDVVVARARIRYLERSPEAACLYLEWAIKLDHDLKVMTEYLFLAPYQVAPDEKKLEACLERLSAPAANERNPLDDRDLRLAQELSLGVGWGFSEYWYDQSPARDQFNEAIGMWPSDPEPVYQGARVNWRTTPVGRGAAAQSFAIELMRKAHSLAPERLDVTVWRGVRELGSYAGNPIEGLRLLEGAAPKARPGEGPVLLEMATLARGLNDYFVGRYADAARQFGSVAGHRGWGQGALQADSLAAAGFLYEALEVSEAWARCDPGNVESYRELGENVRDYLRSNEPYPFSAVEAEELAYRWYQATLKDTTEGPHQVIVNWLETVRAAGHEDWIAGLFGGQLGHLLDRAEMERFRKGSSKGLPDPWVRRRKPRPVARSAALMDQLGAAAESSMPRSEYKPSLVRAGAVTLTVAFIVLLGALRLPSQSPWPMKRGLLGSALVLLALGSWQLSPNSWKDVLRKQTARVTSTLSLARFGPAVVPEDPASLPTPDTAVARALGEAGVPEAPVSVVLALSSLLEPAADRQRSARAIESYLALKPEQKRELLASAGASAFPYLMQKLARGDVAQQELAAGFLEFLDNPKALPLLRLIGREHVARGLASHLERLPIGLAFRADWGRHSVGAMPRCQVLEQLSRVGGAATVPLLVDALETADPSLTRAAQESLSRLTGALGPRSAYQWRTALASPGFRKL